ncbi:hypothetical protein KSP40_PGU017820 [Platanthera guangdongensis]|uniref:3,4-dihydroxy-2-butanone-4-phosphate synthase n=1 Tax=Platanthera guangdongensis TaxID=2320717 RepID=A0ABR2LJB1_9ASPA
MGRYTGNPHDFKGKRVHHRMHKVETRRPTLLAHSCISLPSRLFSLQKRAGEFRGLKFSSQPSRISKTSLFTLTATRNGPVFALLRDNNVKARNDDILFYSTDAINGQDNMLTENGASSGTAIADEFFDYEVERDLDFPTKGFSSVSDAVEDIRQGKLVIVVDDEDRENEGDLIMAASKVTPEAMAFIVRHGTGIVCVSMKGEDLERLQLPQMVINKDNDEKLRTAFTVSVVDASGKGATMLERLGRGVGMKWGGSERELGLDVP